MFLKSIELENFKSFGRKTVIEFRKGYTAITGPNGSGKSNIGDALLFVLGTKSNKSLRAQKLTDLIYKSQNGKMASYLKASVTFDNSDKAIPLEANEVTFTRVVRINEQGDDYYSSYFINDEKARLQDFEFLLERAKIFADGYNFVRQGDITRIIEMSPNERRQILEEVGGISAYNDEINKARDEKNKVSENLLTISTLLTEISTRVQLLSGEKEVAERYLEKKNRISQLDGILLHRRRRSIESEISALNEQINKIKNDMMANENEISRVTKESENIEIEISRMEGDRKSIENLEKLKNEIDALKLTIAKLEMEYENLGIRINQLKQDQTNLNKEKTAYSNKLKSSNENSQQLKSKIDELNQKLAQLESERKAIEERNSAALNQSKEILERMNVLHKEKDGIASTLSSYTNKLTLLNAQRNNLNKELSDLEEAISTLEFSIRDIEWRIKNTSQTPKEVDSLKKRYLELKDKITKLKAEETAITKEIENLQNEIGKTQGAKLSGIWESIDFIMREAANGNLKGIRGTVDSLIKYDAELELAVQAAGGNRLFSIIVDTDENAQAAIELLKKRGKGRLTFLPLNKMIPVRPKGKSLLLMNDPRTMGLMISHIEFPKELEAAVTYVFSDTVLTKNLDLAREVMGGVRIVTLDGDLIDPTNAMTGGQMAKRDLDRNFEQLNAKLTELRQRRDEIRKDIENYDSEMRRLAEELNEINLKVGMEEGAIQQLKTRKDQMEKELQTKRNQTIIKRRELQQVESEIEDVNKQIKMLSESLDKLDLELNNLKDKQEKFLNATDRDRIKSLDSEIGQIKSELESLSLKKKSVDEEIIALNERISSIEKLLSSIESDISNNNSTRAKLGKEIDEQKVKLESMNGVYSQMQKEVRDKESKLMDLINKRNEIKTKIETLQSINKTNFDFKLQLESKLDEARRRLDEILREISEKHAQEVQIQLSNEEIKREISLLENQLKEMEPVNLKAIEDYASEKQRMDELNVKKSTLENEMEKLNQLEKRLEEQKKVIFLDVFNEVNKNFISIYAELTNGQEGYLELENLSNPFEGGLIIKASSKGKKVDNLVSLSGGEKSLAALALILAIQEYDPSPIYFMDEVDMFLDGVNAENVGRLFRRNSERAQIIAVTLRKSTMKYANQMIGVTYQDRSSVTFTKDLTQEVSVA